jgi:hypothetical protein
MAIGTIGPLLGFSVWVCHGLFHRATVRCSSVRLVRIRWAGPATATGAGCSFRGRYKDVHSTSLLQHYCLTALNDCCCVAPTTNQTASHARQTWLQSRQINQSGSRHSNQQGNDSYASLQLERATRRQHNTTQHSRDVPHRARAGATNAQNASQPQTTDHRPHGVLLPPDPAGRQQQRFR